MCFILLWFVFSMLLVWFSQSQAFEKIIKILCSKQLVICVIPLSYVSWYYTVEQIVKSYIFYGGLFIRVPPQITRDNCSSRMSKSKLGTATCNSFARSRIEIHISVSACDIACHDEKHPIHIRKPKDKKSMGCCIWEELMSEMCSVIKHTVYDNLM